MVEQSGAAVGMNFPFKASFVWRLGSGSGKGFRSVFLVLWAPFVPATHCLSGAFDSAEVRKRNSPGLGRRCHCSCWSGIKLLLGCQLFAVDLTLQLRCAEMRLSCPRVWSLSGLQTWCLNPAAGRSMCGLGCVCEKCLVHNYTVTAERWDQSYVFELGL